MEFIYKDETLMMNQIKWDTNNNEERKTILSFFLIIKNIENEQF